MQIRAFLAAALTICSPGVASAQTVTIELLRAQRAVMDRVVAAALAGDAPALAEEHVLGVPYMVVIDVRHPEPKTAFSVNSLKGFATCSHLKPEATGINWWTVEWECPSSLKLPWPYASTSFRFDGLKIAEIRTGHGALRFQRLN